MYDLEERKCLKQYKMTGQSVDDILRHTARLERRRGEEVSTKRSLMQALCGRQYVEDPVRFGAMPQSIPYIQGTRTPVEDIREFIQIHKEELDCIDIVVRSEAFKHELWEELRKAVRDVYITSSVCQLLEISHRDAGKDSGARFLLDFLGLRKEELAAFGDADNDIGLLKAAGIGFAVANASAECKEAADRLVASNDEDGVARGIEEILAMG